MGSKKHKKHKSERRDKYEEYSSEHRSSSLKLVLKVGSNSTPEYGNDSPAYGAGDLISGSTNINYAGSSNAASGFFADDFPEKQKKSKKKKKKKDREKKHKHHKEKRRRRHTDSSQEEEMSFCDENSQHLLQERMLQYSSISAENSPANRPLTKLMVPLKIDEPDQPIHSPTPSISPLKECVPTPTMLASPGTVSTPGTISTQGSITPAYQQPITPKLLEAPKTPSSISSESGREPRSCVLKLMQSKSPLTRLLDHLLRSLEKRDPHQFFAWPVTDDIAPGYSSIIDVPMDFSTIRQKIEDNEYLTLTEFVDDFKLMCENAIRYNHVETVYHKAAKKLLHVGMKILHPEHLMRSLKPMSNFIRDLTAKELGFELRFNEHGELDPHIIDSADECASTGADEPMTQAQIDEENKRKRLRLENAPKSKFEPYVDDMTSEEILSQVQNAALEAKKRLTNRKKAHNMGFLRQNKDGSTSMNILLGNDLDGPEKVVNLGNLVGKLEHGTGQLQGFREDRRNMAKIVKPLNYGAFSSFAPIFDSRFSNLSKEETELILSTYGDATSAEYAESIMDFTRDSSYASVLANGLLDVLTQGEHSRTMGTLYDNQIQRCEQTEIERTFPDEKIKAEEDLQKYKDVKIDFNKLKSLEEIGIDMSFLDDLKQGMQTYELQKKVEDQLRNNLQLIEKLHSTQHDRLSQPLPTHLGNVQPPGPYENDIAIQITQNLTEIAKKFTPAAIAEPHALRKAMGISDVGLHALQQSKISIPSILQDRINPAHQILGLSNRSTGQTPMDIDHQPHGSVDLESELREFLENGTGLTSSTNDDNSIEQMLLN